MALHDELPIYKDAYGLLTTATGLIKNMPRDFKRSVGGEISQDCVKIMVLIFRANSARNKVPHLDELLERLQVVTLLLRLSRDMKLISLDGYSAAVKLANSVGRQASGWRRSASPAS